MHKEGTGGREAVNGTINVKKQGSAEKLHDWI
jgi:hypothetical protein